MGHVKNPLQRLRLFAKDRYQHLTVWPLGLPAHIIMEREGRRPPVGVLAPPMDYCHEAPRLREALRRWDEDGLPYRVVSEAQLTMEWDGLDELLVGEKTVSDLGWRQLEGFRAAGGEVRVV